MDNIEKVVLLIFLAYESFEDIKFQTISLKSIIFFLLIGIGFNIIFQNNTLIEFIYAFFLGVGLLIFSVATRQAIGIGDAFIVGCVAIWKGWNYALEVLILGLLICCMFSIILLMLRRAKAKTSIPFIPFVLIAFIFINFWS